jgi:hypothetical protein
MFSQIFYGFLKGKFSQNFLTLEKEAFFLKKLSGF